MDNNQSNETTILEKSFHGISKLLDIDTLTQRYKRSGLIFPCNDGYISDIDIEEEDG